MVVSTLPTENERKGEMRSGEGNRRKEDEGRRERAGLVGKHGERLHGTPVLGLHEAGREVELEDEVRLWEARRGLARGDLDRRCGWLVDSVGKTRKTVAVAAHRWMGQTEGNP